MKSKSVWLLSVVIVTAGFATACDHVHGHDHSAPPAPSGVNPVQHEMRLLQDAMRDTVTAIAAGDVKPVAHALHKVHGAKEATGAAIKAGSYKPPKNGDAMAKFESMDEAFHKDLEGLVEASSKNDVAGTAAALGKAMSSCNGCHTEFRK